ncbi:hypothetical protein HWV62_14388 [Athelia sp. TMB]|nr:hypothetical protein HWV62_15597 [Athelia sp. TMB]KAF7973707.1 hypothetical protein HWV62_14388 [Athelia sp. TMB]
MAERAKTHRRWSEKHAGLIMQAAAQAMKLWESTDLVASDVFLVFLDVDEYVESNQERKIMFLRTIKEAKCVPIAEVHAMYDGVFKKIQASAIDGSLSGHDALEAALSHRSGLLRMVIIDECPFGLRTPFFDMMPADIDGQSFHLARDQLPADGDWLRLFREQVALDDNAWKTAARQEAFHRWIDKEQVHAINASLHAMNLRKEPNRTDTDVFVISLNCREEVISAAGQISTFVHTVRKAYAVPAEEVDNKYAIALESFAGASPRKAGERHLRMLIVDDNSGHNNQMFVSPSLYAIPSDRVIPSFDPEWLSILKENARS